MDTRRCIPADFPEVNTPLFGQSHAPASLASRTEADSLGLPVSCSLPDSNHMQHLSCLGQAALHVVHCI